MIIEKKAYFYVKFPITLRQFFKKCTLSVYHDQPRCTWEFTCRCFKLLPGGNHNLMQNSFFISKCNQGWTCTALPRSYVYFSTGCNTICLQGCKVVNKMGPLTNYNGLWLSTLHHTCWLSYLRSLTTWTVEFRAREFCLSSNSSFISLIFIEFIHRHWGQGHWTW